MVMFVHDDDERDKDKGKGTPMKSDFPYSTVPRGTVEIFSDL